MIYLGIFNPILKTNNYEKNILYNNTFKFYY